MVVLDLTVMNIALPSAQRASHFTTADRQWVVTAYTLAFGNSFCSVEDWRTDSAARRRFLWVWWVSWGFLAVGGASVNFAMLVIARACQGALVLAGSVSAFRCSRPPSPLLGTG